ncbi:8-amino-7-oxononanoate synthase [Simiduia agarivorans]|uniref:8-amino-7-oxononanoate synthase n=1 Tax=Simiduia agarivorans (strain DSM 21679 / JCM 13881 / BCRC 17597 / SA1) TaxID=1117647 RepID=K4KZ51_SIMAS|nr:8-amino-7-oxononanoate synthase [Simiduia agarivorans]AFU99177.1 8-amino-7-oxononanoate synthase [Simiduia agarivorans SA1 = DSM 21679]
MKQRLAARLAERRAQHLYRRRREVQSAQQPALNVDGKPLLGFCSNDYLGLANHPRLIEAFTQAASRYGVGSGASHLVCGHSHEHHALEQALADYTGRERALLFSTGYMANLGTIAALVESGDTVLQDKLNHASLLDGGLASGAKFSRYLHNDVAQLGKKLAAASGEKLVVTDGVFSMDGDLAPLDQIAAVCAQHNAWLMVDDAHGFGVLGETGAGSAEYFGLNSEQLPVYMATLGKAIGSFGAFVAGSEALIENLIQFARPYIYTTALPPAVAAASCAALALARNEPERRQHLNQLIVRFRTGAASLDLDLMDSFTAIQPIRIGDADTALRWSQALEQQGIWVGAIRPPTVPAGSSRLRITLTAAHTAQQVDQLLDALAHVQRALT